MTRSSQEKMDDKMQSDKHIKTDEETARQQTKPRKQPALSTSVFVHLHL